MLPFQCKRDSHRNGGPRLPDNSIILKFFASLVFLSFYGWVKRWSSGEFWFRANTELVGGQPILPWRRQTLPNLTDLPRDGLFLAPLLLSFSSVHRKTTKLQLTYIHLDSHRYRHPNSTSCNDLSIMPVIDSSRPTDPDGLVVEAWGQGMMVGSLVIMVAITLSNMKKHILLHKLILAEVQRPT